MRHSDGRSNGVFDLDLSECCWCVLVRFEGESSHFNLLSGITKDVAKKRGASHFRESTLVLPRGGHAYIYCSYHSCHDKVWILDLLRRANMNVKLPSISSVIVLTLGTAKGPLKSSSRALSSITLDFCGHTVAIHTHLFYNFQTSEFSNHSLRIHL